MKTLLLALVTLFAQAATPPAAKPGGDYVVGVKDVLQVVVRGFDDYSLPNAIVDADGTIQHPDIGRIQVIGKTEREIAEEIRVAFMKKDILTKPVVTVTVKEYRSQNITIIGDGINKPGTYPVRGDADLLQAIGEAGGFNSQAGSTVVVTRRTSPPAAGAPAKEERLEVPRTELEMGRASRIFLRDGDTIFVSRAEVFFIDGQVRSPNEYVMRRNLTFGQAIVIAGGYTDRARKGKIEVQRMVNGEIKKVSVKETDLVKAGDKVHIPSRWW